MPSKRMKNAGTKVTKVLFKKALIKGALNIVKTRQPMKRHPVRVLFENSAEVRPYPRGVVEVREQIQGTSFFPGGTGLWWGGARTIPALPVGKVMILGHDFHSVAGYEWSLKHAEENLKTTTWLHLQDLLKRVPIRLEDCFFTNIFLGLRKGAATTGRFPGADDPEFVDRCRKFFLRQMAVQQPRLILALGTYVPQFLAPLSEQLAPVWTTPSSFPRRDRDKTSIRTEVVFKNHDRHPCVVASIVHPCMRNSNVRHRHWYERNLHGDAAELALLQHAVDLAGMK